MILVQLQIRFTTVYYRDQDNDVLHMQNMGVLTILTKKQDQKLIAGREKPPVYRAK